jgi:hypothetical protein
VNADNAKKTTDAQKKKKDINEVANTNANIVTNANNITNANHIIENNDTKNAKKKTKKTKK